MALFDRIRNWITKSYPFSMLVPLISWDWSDTPTTEQMIRDTYYSNPLVHAAVNFKANSAGKVNLKIFQNGKLVEDHPAAKLIQTPNAWMNQSDLWKQIILDLNLFGRSAWQKIRTNAGKPIGLWRLRPDWLVARVEGDQVVWDYHAPTGALVFQSEDLVVFRSYDPLNPLGSMSPLSVVYPLVKLDNALTKFQSQYIQSGGVPPIVLKVKGIIPQSRAEELRQRWSHNYGGIQNWTTPAVLDADADVQRIGFSLDELDFKALQEKIESRISAVFGVSPILLNLPTGLDRSTYSNYEQALKSFWIHVLIPQLEDLKDVLDNQLLSEFGVTSEWDWGEVVVLQQDYSDSLGVLLQACLNGVISFNEFRRYLDLEDLPEDERTVVQGQKSQTVMLGKRRALSEDTDEFVPMTLEEFYQRNQDLFLEPLQEFWEQELDKTKKELIRWLKDQRKQQNELR
jgi:HK97 family phage portal protein